ncbi:hypothetical protein J6590_093604 [Homalodisca vitripennis]|nr:hypothetical protein J6590_093604 [Homalodisca vitripennis]
MGRNGVVPPFRPRVTAQCKQDRGGTTFRHATPFRPAFPYIINDLSITDKQNLVSYANAQPIKEATIFTVCSTSDTVFQAHITIIL